MNPRDGSVATNFNGSVAGTIAAVSSFDKNCLTHIIVGNTTAAIAYLQIFNKVSTAVTVGTTAPDMVVMVPIGGSVAIEFDKPIKMFDAAGLSCACTTARAGATGATCEVNIGYLGGS